ncbi:cupin domain-containing protein [Maricurvus nonylphenolicus]|uniref:cupin domain-containing protein n=1 Tax=Maricurvus nonylphenolicus TaxID=1008307 RepID=UPI0036F2FF6A
MTVRQVVTGHDETGHSIFISDDQIQANEVRFMPGFQSFELWSTQANRQVPHQGSLPGVPSYFPSREGSVFRMISFPPQAGETPDMQASEDHLAELQTTLPGLLEHLELDAPGMHTTDSIDYGIVLTGEIYLELDNGQERLLKAGDCVVQNGTRHAWHNRSGEPTLMAFILLGAQRAI